ncbi:hypothetical protein ASPVEDRAFT_81317 [Aspergillus versicolor CBS 583.65]|uniref:Uncharacterized protein n=1 Tax=Aspergillus versicolor CBS 583.65 TaxID=1036611 RepID=A0A1L9PE00_ASPVE|nr:uncharacterized protein ASPVEDRAFT_81317 [Aspergillus versicolor CBS 583.65]OJI99722.1 hypothetical protein ASPVEDRAFT_81317 [Aspergillus versicolor CBS 583.65]
MESPSRAFFNSLPPELKLIIWDNLDKGRDKSALALTSRTNHALLDHHLYRWILQNTSTDGIFTKPPILGWMAGRGAVRAMKKLIAAGADPLDPIVLPLCIACRNGRKAMVRLLLEEYKVDPNIANAAAFGGGDSPLYAAIDRDDCGIATLLLTAGADPNARPALIGRHSMLTYAITAGHIKTAALLIEAGASVTYETDNNRTPLWFAIQKGDVELVRKILDALRTIPGADINVGAPLVAACKLGRTELARLLLENGALIDTVEPILHGWDSLVASLLLNRVEILRVLFEHGVSPATLDSAVNNGVVLAAITHGLRDAIEVLITNNVPVHRAVPFGHKSRPRKPWALECAATHNNKEMAELLLRAGVSDTMSARDKSTLLWNVFRPGYEEMLVLLIGSGACEHTPRYRAWSANPPLHHAITLNMPSLVSLMLQKGADPNSRDPNGDTALTAAVKLGSPRMVVILLGDDTDPETWTRPSDVLAGESSQTSRYMQYIDNPDAQGCTPLYLATCGEREDIVRILLARGSRAFHTQNHAGWSPVGLATFYKDWGDGPEENRPFRNIFRLLNNAASARIDRELLEDNSVFGPRSF